jgi:Arc/MetJ-type ribon-helix-helix transcriptional regulator
MADTYDKRMSDSKERLSVSVDSALAAQARQAVAEGRALTISSWVSDALRRQADHDARLRALDEFITDYEAEHGEISAEELAGAKRRAASKAVISRGAA